MIIIARIQKQNHATIKNIYQLHSNVPQWVVSSHLQAEVDILVKFCL